MTALHALALHPVLGFFNLNPMEVLIIAVLALLIFGKRLPEVGRSLGKGIVEFKKGLAGVEDDVNSAGSQSAQRQVPRQPEAPPALPPAQGHEYAQGTPVATDQRQPRA